MTSRTFRSAVALLVVSAASCIITGNVLAQAGQAPPARGRGQGQARGGRGGPPGGGPIAFDDHTGFRQIFDGKSLTGWDGDPSLWRAEGGAIVGETTAAAPLKQNSFLIWRAGEPADFELKLEFRINSTNSGVQYRSAQVPPSGEIGKWVLRGYQADIDFENQFTGMLYEERGRAFLAPRGTFGYVGPKPARPARRARKRRRAQGVHQAKRLEPVPCHRPRQHAGAHPERTRHRAVPRRRCGRAIDARAAWISDSCRTADESGVQESLVERDQVGRGFEQVRQVRQVQRNLLAFASFFSSWITYSRRTLQHETKRGR